MRFCEVDKPTAVSKKQDQKYIKETKDIISNNIYMTIATASKEGRPWISPVFFAYDDLVNLYWVSDKNSRHSTLIRANKNVAIVIFDSSAPEGEADGVYIEAIVKELSYPLEIQKAMSIYSGRAKQDEFKVWKIDDVTRSAQWRMYKATPIRISKLSDGEYVNGQYVDRRININLKKII